jgi:two-component system, chemotaxis family, chemotaxis protein CheY
MSDSQSRYVLDNVNVLVLDDNRHMRSLVQSILHALGVKNVCEAADAAQAFKELQHFQADVLIVDWHMEPLDGLDFVRLVRTAKDSPNPYVPIIMLSGYTEYRRVTEARDAGVNEFLAKPISAKALYQRFAAIIDNPRPFIRTKTYFGPDRRRQNLGPPRGLAERRKDATATAKLARAASGGGLTSDQIQPLMENK